ncbi:hypothetical protein RclHR1_13300003 [Rhizophagus clarus]|uniref:Helix-loop-helix DNA-binding domain-containing transcription factor n=1 Tax=Rhizophagus clarus TaxID=94130 RepID=A0A2Z6QPP4_9GLOM|nr:hypothetical protein RclHR1_13300003 [Rhizophagus clarus]GES93702.1 helix-loop-helix DNA-binding domain-containing transcription factor [Rhizophagus clarus]
MSQYYSNDNTLQQNHNREPPRLLSSSFMQPELNSHTQHFSMSESGYQTSTDQYGIHSPGLSQLPVPMSEPPPYDEFDEYNWPSGISTNLTQPSEDFNNQQLFNQADEQYFFGDFLGGFENDNFIFSPTLPSNMPIYPNQTPDNDDPSSHSYIIPGQTATTSPSTLNQNQFSSTNSTSLSPRTSNITLSSSPPSVSNNHNHNHDDDDDEIGDDVSSVNGKADGSSTPTIPAKRKPINDGDRNGRRSSNPRLSPIITKLSMTQSNSNINNNNNNVTKSLSSPSIQLSSLSINNNNNNTNGIINNNNYDDSPSTPSSSNNNSPSPETPTMEIVHPKNDDSELISSASNNLSNVDDNDDFSSTEIKTEDPSSSSPSTKPTPQKSSRKPYKELLTEEEKRANHIASEQKRRNTIRAGFKELTDIIPTLKNVNNSKSTILFKAVDYIKYLERRNRNLKERAGLLEMRVEMEMRQGKRFHHHPHPHGNPFGPTTMGFGHQRVAPMPMNYSVIPNGMTAIPIGPSGHPSQRQPPHVMTAPHHPIYFVPSNENPPSMIPGNVVSPSNNIFRGATMGMQIPLSSSQQQQNHHHSQQDNVPGMNIPSMASDDDGNNGGVDIDGDASMLGMNGSATRVGVKC